MGRKRNTGAEAKPSTSEIHSAEEGQRLRPPEKDKKRDKSSGRGCFGPSKKTIIRQLEAELEAAGKHFQGVTDDFKEQVAELKRERNEAQERIKELEEQQEDTLEKEKQNNEKQKEQIKELESENTRLRNDRDEAQSENVQLRKERDEVKSENVQLRKERDEAQREISALEDQRNGLREDVRNLEHTLAQSQSQLGRLQQENNSQKSRLGRLQQENKTQKDTIGDYKMRLSEMASKRMREGNSCVEDLNDPYRPTAVTDKWNSLFKTGEYWTAYEKLSPALKGDDEIAECLHKVTKVVWDACVGLVEEVVPRVEVLWPGSTELPRPGNEEELRQHMQKELPRLRERLQSLLPEGTVQVDACVKAFEEGYMSVLQTDIPKLQQKLRKHVCLLPKGDCPPAVLTQVNKAIEEDETIDKRVEVDANFLKKLAKLCYIMRLQEVPLSVNFDFSPGSPLDLSMFETDSTSSQPSADWRIKSVLRPPLLRSEGGAVLSKGEVDVVPAAQPAQPRDPQQDSQPGQEDSQRNGQGDAEEGGQGDREEGGQGDREEGRQEDREEGEQGGREEGGQEDGEEGRQGDRQEGRQGDREEGRQGDREEGGQEDGEEGRQGDRQEGRQGDREEGRQGDKEGRQGDREGGGQGKGEEGRQGDRQRETEEEQHGNRQGETEGENQEEDK